MKVQIRKAATFCDVLSEEALEEFCLTHSASADHINVLIVIEINWPPNPEMIRVGWLSDEEPFPGGIIWTREPGARLVVGPDRDFFQCLHDHRLSPLKKKAAANKASPMRITVAGDRECQRSWRM